ncbi:MAG: hypothetical protein GYA24_05420 [Candidatus Lokiarchaeota archaeon]|nr:hypothetical protein [Candidatus Lokiarchaeota archaeon]
MMTKNEKWFYLLVRMFVLVFLIPILVQSIMFTRVFARALRKTLRARGLNEVQRVLNWKGITGIFELARGSI